MDDYLKDLRPEYADRIPDLTRRFHKLHPDGDAAERRRYVQSQVLRDAHRMVDLRKLASLSGEDPLDVRRILQTHMSWRERLGGSHVLMQLRSFLRKARTVADIGCGLTPVWLLDACPRVERCVGFEPNRRLAMLVQRLCEKLRARCATIHPCGFSSAQCGELAGGRFDLVLVQKLIPALVSRHDRRTLEALSRINFRNMLVTGSKFSLARTISIEAEERESILDFIRQARFRVVRVFDAEKEFGYLVTRGGR